MDAPLGLPYGDNDGYGWPGDGAGGREVDPDLPLEPEEGDLITYDHRKVWCDGKLWLTLTEDEDFNATVRDQMERMNWFPNVWFVSDHGNAHLITITAETIIPGPGEDGYALNDEEEAAWQLANS